MEWLGDFAYRWYMTMSQVSAAIGAPVQQLLASQNIPAISALLLGLLGGLAPCQVTANAGAIAYITQRSHQRHSLWGAVGAFLGGKAMVYLLLGILAAVLGFRLPTPVMMVLRKLSGPLMILIGLHLLGWIKWNGSVGLRVTEWFQARLPRRGSAPCWLGVVLSLGFCPTMAVIFFGALVPLVLQARAGLALPVFFAIGTAVPVLLWAVAWSGGREVAGRWVKRVRNTNPYIKWIAALAFLLLGLNDTVLYWFV